MLKILLQVFAGFVALITSTQPIKSPMPSPLPTSTYQSTATIRATPTSKPKPKPTVKPSTPDPDPMVNCSVSTNCGGGTKLLKKSICSNTVCCEIEVGKWYFYENNNKCKQDQDAYWSNYSKGSSNYVAPNSNYSSVQATINPATTTHTTTKTNQEYRTECINQVKANYDPSIAKYKSQGELYKSYVGSLTRDRDSAVGSCMVRYPTYLDN